MKTRFAKNKHGVRIRCCCVSCEHCSFGMALSRANEFRTCYHDSQRPVAVHQTDCCKHWVLAERFTEIKFSKEPGRIKRQEYFQLVTNIRQLEKEQKATTTMANEDIRALYEAEHHQSVYLDK